MRLGRGARQGLAGPQSGGGGWAGGGGCGITRKMPLEEKVVSLGQVTCRTLLLLQTTVPEAAQHRPGPKYDLGPCV